MIMRHGFVKSLFQKTVVILLRAVILKYLKSELILDHKYMGLSGLDFARRITRPLSCGRKSTIF